MRPGRVSRTILAAALFGGGGAVPAAAQSSIEQPREPAWSLEKALGSPAGLTVQLNIRARLDQIDGQARPGFNAHDTTVNLRTALFVEYDAGDWRIGGELIDARVYGGNRGSPVSANDVNAFEPAQLYLAYDRAGAFGAGSRATIKAGRMVLNLGSRRLVSADTYRNTSQTYGGVYADLAGGGWRGEFYYVLPSTRLPEGMDDVLSNRVAFDRESFDTVLWGGRIERAGLFGGATAEATFVAFRERDRADTPTRDRSLNTAGARLFRPRATGRIDWEVEGFYQWGTISSGIAAGAPRVPVAAGFFHADIGYGWAGGWRPRVSLRFDYVSGDRPGGSFNRFDTLYGMRRAEIGPSGLYNSVARANLLSPGLRVEAAPDRRTDLYAMWRPLWLASRFDSFSTTGVRDANGRSGRFAGHQFELRVAHWLVPEALRLEWNGILLAKRGFLRRAPNAPATGDTAYSSLNLSAFF